MERREWRGVGQALPTVTKTLAGMFIVQVTDQRLVAAFERKEDYETAITEHNQHATLVEQRDLLVGIAKDALRFRELNYGECGHDTLMVKVCSQCEIRAALATVEQGGKP